MVIVSIWGILLNLFLALLWSANPSECELKVAKKPQIFARPFGKTSDHFESEESLDSAVSSLKFNKLRNAGIVCSFCAEKGGVFLQLNLAENPICSIYLKSKPLFYNCVFFSGQRSGSWGSWLVCWGCCAVMLKALPNHMAHVLYETNLCFRS